METLRSIQVVNVRWFNATAWYGIFLSRLLLEAGHEVKVLALPDSAPFAKAEAWGLKPEALPLNSDNPVTMLRLYAQLKNLVQEWKPHVVNCHRGEGFMLWGMLRKNLGGFALVRTRGDQRPPRNNLINRKLHGEVADAIIATNSRTARAFTGDLRISSHKVHTIIGGVDENIFRPSPEKRLAVRQALGLGPRDFVIGLLGRLDPVKGHAVLIQALGLLKQKYGAEFNIRFLCIGDGKPEAHEHIKGLLALSCLDAEGRITGIVDDVPGYLNALDLGVLASVGSEAIARAALEIMACEIPLLSSDVGVMPDLLPPELLVPAGDVRALEMALEKYWQNPLELEELRSRSLAAMRHLHSEDFLARAMQVYQACLARLED